MYGNVYRDKEENNKYNIFIGYEIHEYREDRTFWEDLEIHSTENLGFIVVYVEDYDDIGKEIRANNFTYELVSNKDISRLVKLHKNVQKDMQGVVIEDKITKENKEIATLVRTRKEFDIAKREFRSKVYEQYINFIEFTKGDVIKDTELGRKYQYLGVVCEDNYDFRKGIPSIMNKVYLLDTNYRVIEFNLSYIANKINFEKLGNLKIKKKEVKNLERNIDEYKDYTKIRKTSRGVFFI